MKFTPYNIIRIFGAIVTIIYLTYYFINPFGFLKFMLGFLVIYILFLKLLPHLELKYTK